MTGKQKQIPNCFAHASNCRTLSRKYGATMLTVAVDVIDPKAPVLYRLDGGEEWEYSALRTHDVRHDPTQALPLVWRWLGNQRA